MAAEDSKRSVSADLGNGSPSMTAQTLTKLIGTQGLSHEDDFKLQSIGALQAMIDDLEAGQVSQVFGAISETPTEICTALDATFVKAFFGSDPVDYGQVDDTAALCGVILSAFAHDASGGLEDLRVEICRRPAAEFQQSAKILKSHLAALTFKNFVPKLVIWDLDDTLWRGTLAEGDQVVLNEFRANCVRRLNEHGTVSAICSKNDAAIAQAQLEAFGLWGEFVFPRIAFVPKGEAVAKLIADMQLRAVDVLFVDDNTTNLAEVRARVPGIRTVNAADDTCNEVLDLILSKPLARTRSRVAEYRALQERVEEKEGSGLSNREFLRQSGINIAITRGTDNLDFSARIAELINRSNQLNYTETRIPERDIVDFITEVIRNETYAVFVWDRYGYHGLVGFASINPDTRLVQHFAFSCRVMHMGIEDALIARVRSRYGSIDLSLLRKPLPESDGEPVLTEVDFHDLDVRERLLAKEAPRPRSKVSLRIMADCQSGALCHYSRIADETEFDNNPRLFTLPMVATGELGRQHFPPYLVYTAATDYVSHRWSILPGGHSDDRYAACARQFCEFLSQSQRKLLVFLPAVEANSALYFPNAAGGRSFPKERGQRYNRFWRDLECQYPNVISLIDLTDHADDGDMRDANHYVPPFLRRMSTMMDDWYEGTGTAAIISTAEAVPEIQIDSFA